MPSIAGVREEISVSGEKGSETFDAVLAEFSAAANLATAVPYMSDATSTSARTNCAKEKKNSDFICKRFHVLLGW